MTLKTIFKILPVFFVTVFVLGCQTSSVKKGSKQGYKGHGEDSISEEIVAKFLPQKLPANETRKIEALLDIRSPGRGLITSDKKHLLFSWGVTGVRQIWKSNGPNQFPVQLTGGEDATRLLEISPNNQFAVVSRDEKGNEHPGFYYLSLSGGPLNPIYMQKKVRPRYGFVSNDSKWVYFLANDNHPVNYRLYRKNIESGEKELLLDTPGSWYIADRDEKRGILLMANLTGSRSAEFSEFNLKTKKLTPVLGQGEKESYWVKLSRKPGEYFVLTDKMRDFQTLYHYKNKKFKAIAKEDGDIERFSLSPNKRHLTYSLNRKGYKTLKMISSSSFKPRWFPSFKSALHVTAGSFSKNSRFLPFTVSYPTRPSVNYVFDMNNGKFEQWTKSSTPEIDTTNFVKPSLEYYTTRDGTKIPMFVKRPTKCNDKTKDPCPVIVQFHGGPESQARPFFSASSQYFLNNGFVMVFPNVRGSSGYGRKWAMADDGPKRLEVLSDIEDAAIYIKKNWASNSGKSPRIGVMGGSYGGYATMMAMTKYAGAYDAGVAIVGMSSLLSFLQNTAPYRRHLRVTEYGDPEKDLDALKKLSAINYIDRARDPLLIIHGVTDPRVPVGEAYQMHQMLEKRGVKSELMLFPDEGHGVRKRKNVVLYLGHIVRFFSKQLK